MTSLVTIAEHLLADADETAKPLPYYAIYQQYFTPLAERPRATAPRRPEQKPAEGRCCA